MKPALPKKAPVFFYVIMLEQRVNLYGISTSFFGSANLKKRPSCTPGHMGAEPAFFFTFLPMFVIMHSN